MGQLNQPRSRLPYDFRVVEMHEIVWLYDNSQHTYCCSFQPAYWLEPLYWCDTGRMGDEDYPLPDAGYYDTRLVDDCQNAAAVDVSDTDNWDDCDETAWDDARDEVHGNYPL